MAIGWLTVLQSVPWSDVISNAPKVADGARKLWKAVGRKTQPAELADVAALAGGTLEARIAALDAAVTDLHGQMLASSELIQALAEQNAQLVARIESNRVRVLWLGVATAVIAVAALAGLLLALSRQGA